MKGCGAPQRNHLSGGPASPVSDLHAGHDRITFAEEHREAAEILARLLPEVRRRGQEIAGVAVRPLRVIVSTDAPPAGEYYPVRYLSLLAGMALGLVALFLRDEFSRPIHLLCLAAGGLSGAVLGLVVAGKRRLTRGLQRMWPPLGGVCFDYDQRLPPVIMVQWPRPEPLPIVMELTFRTPEQEPYLAGILAHEYAHALLRARYCKRALPVWWDEGFAFWFTEQVLGQPVWRPESRAHLSEPEPRRNARRLFGQDAYVRLCACYYWEVRDLIEDGRLPELLRTPVRRLADFGAKAVSPDHPTPAGRTR